MVRSRLASILCMGALVLGTGAVGRISAAELPQPLAGENIYILQGPRAALQFSIRVQRLPGESCTDLSWRILERELGCPELEGSQVPASSVYLFPLAKVGPGLRGRVLRAIFPGDRVGPEGWQHTVVFAPEGERAGETLWSLAELLCGSGQRYRELQQTLGLDTETLQPGQVLLVPAAMLVPGLAELPGAREQVMGELTYRSDEKGPYAAYRLKAGEALYSSVIIRFTDRITGSEVLEGARIVLQRSGIKDARSIPAGFEIKIPRELISPQYLPPDDALRREYEAHLAETRTYRRGERALHLTGVRVILDPGHGGQDPGAIGCCGVAEDELAYDVACRLRRILMEESRAEVSMTVEDRAHGFAPVAVLPGTDDRAEHILTHPPYECGDTGTAAHMRWYLANSIFRAAAKAKVPSDRVVFLSIHADDLHPSAQGVMVYVPDAALRTGSIEKRGRVYDARAEVREGRKVSFTRKQRNRSEGLSRQLAARIVDCFQKARLPVHRNQPIRGHIRRGKARWVPAVLRYNQVPTSVLVELANMRNPQDCASAGRHQTREEMARALYQALVEYYSD